MRDDSPMVRSVLIVGCGPDHMPQWGENGYTVTRLDIDPKTEPNIVASMTDMGAIGPFDVVFCSHALEHLYPHEVPIALAEFHRVLKPNGVAMIVVPDLEDVRPTDDVIPDNFGLCGLDLFYGHGPQIMASPHMAHHCGFVADTLKRVMETAGFATTTKRAPKYQLMATGVRQ